ncbi:MAG: ribosome biogenesis GTPase YlqF [Lachnospiraceae bacterium]|nr:ribosome biogenesis GTPase YlqF [Ruminococcus sp.]MCM1275871.1 ribosome biogenesis GTPase YlqF [Lachnospiraceae bacterium]
MSDVGNIQWFPGHMTKTRRLIEADLKMVDAVAEVTDARIPESSRNPIIDELAGSKPRIMIMNKCDVADEMATAAWRKYYESRGICVIVCDCRSGKGINKFLPAVKRQLAELIERRKARGMIGKALRLMVVGIPNVGKSSFINRMANSKKTKVGDRPGVTRGKQWVSIDRDVELLDMPGILWPKFDDKDVALKLAFTGAVKDEVMDTAALARALGETLLRDYPELVKARYKIAGGGDILTEIAGARGMLISGGEPDTERAAAALLDEFRGGRIGRITLEMPPETNGA